MMWGLLILVLVYLICYLHHNFVSVKKSWSHRIYFCACSNIKLSWRFGMDVIKCQQKLDSTVRKRSDFPPTKGMMRWICPSFEICWRGRGRPMCILQLEYRILWRHLLNHVSEVTIDWSTSTYIQGVTGVDIILYWRVFLDRKQDQKSKADNSVIFFPKQGQNKS